MDYSFEKLNGKSFQKICQSLLIGEFSGVQCYPVGQPDGGRDAVRHLDDGGFVVYQVKFVRNPADLSSGRDWLIATMSNEVPKIKKLVQRGAIKYVLMTNVGGSAHLDVGSIDRMDDLLNEDLGIPAVCWWRDDLERKLDSQPKLKWSHPALLSGVDALNELVGAGLPDENRRRRERTIRSFLADQYSIDELVKFKQVELQDNLLDLFIDVPLAMPSEAFEDDNHAANRLGRSYMEAAFSEMEERDRGNTSAGSHAGTKGRRIRRHFVHRQASEKATVGAATFFLNDHVQESVNTVVLEGAPGQGKSTIAQYICQVHRMKLLGKQSHLNQLPPYHHDTPVRLPFRIDLRDLASWWKKENPFATELDVPTTWNQSVESFLAFLVHHHSGGAPFEVDDLHAALSTSPALLVFDGLDEVADLNLRSQLAEAIARLHGRLSEVSLSVQVVVTSRPAALAESPQLPPPFEYLRLGPVGTQLAQNYAARWSRARRLNTREVQETRDIFERKLEKPHIRELATNPMQLTILLSLIHTRGASLPEKRTALYKNYVDLFFSREAEKNRTVREQRNLLISIHRYLGWFLHAQAEEEGASGRLTDEELRDHVQQYLSQRGYSEIDVDELLAGMKERIVALVSRVEGTYEFGVQPLREYFAAGFLYHTAPYAPSGEHKPGTKPERFRSVARNPYWQNVARFFAGFFSQGELPMLVHELGELMKSEDLGSILYPRELASVLLGDWVFSHYPKNISKVVGLMTEPPGMRLLLSLVNSIIFRPDRSSLPEGAGRSELFKKSFQILKEGEAEADVKSAAAVLAHANSPSDQALFERWKTSYDNVGDDKRSEWLSFALRLGVLKDATTPELDDIFGHDSLTSDQKDRVMFSAGLTDYIELIRERYTRSLEMILSGKTFIKLPGSGLGAFAKFFRLSVYRVFESGYPQKNREVPLYNILRDHRRHDRHDYNSTEAPQFEEAERVARFVDFFDAELKKPVSTWAESIEPWRNVIELGTGLFGRGDGFLVIAMFAAETVYSFEEETLSESDYLVAPDDFELGCAPLCHKMLTAKHHSSNARFWENCIEAVDTDSSSVGLAALIIAYASRSVRVELASLIDTLISLLDETEWNRLNRILGNLQGSLDFDDERRMLPDDIKSLPASLSSRGVATLGFGTPLQTRRKIYTDYLTDYQFDQNLPWWSIIAPAMDFVVNEPDHYEPHLDFIALAYQERPQLNDEIKRYEVHHIDDRRLPCSETVLENSDRYPLALIEWANDTATRAQKEQIKPLIEVARSSKWFE